MKLKIYIDAANDERIMLHVAALGPPEPPHAGCVNPLYETDDLH